MAKPEYYDEVPTYIMHSDGVQNDGVFHAVDGSGDTLDIALTADSFDSTDAKGNKLTITNIGDTDTIVINGVTFYSKASVDSLLSALETSLKAWANGTFVHNI